jgi:hypothetical protein
LALTLTPLATGQLPLEDVEDATLLGGVRALKELEQDRDGFLTEKVTSCPLFLFLNSCQPFSSPLLYLDSVPASDHNSQSKYRQMHNWIYRMLADGFLWTHFIEYDHHPSLFSLPASPSLPHEHEPCSFLRQEYSEESGCFLRDVYELHAMISHARHLLADPSYQEPEAVPPPYSRLTRPAWKSLASVQLVLDAIDHTAEAIYRLYLTKVTIASDCTPTDSAPIGKSL